MLNRYVQTERAHCGSSTVSGHVFSPDGQHWHALEPAIQVRTQGPAL